MVKEMPDIEHKVHKGHCDKKLGPLGQLHQVEHSPLTSCDVRGSRDHSSSEYKFKDHAVKYGKGYVIDPAFCLGDRAFAVGCQKFQNQEKKDGPPERRSPDQ
jgi:hypothetical protein